MRKIKLLLTVILLVLPLTYLPFSFELSKKAYATAGSWSQTTFTGLDGTYTHTKPANSQDDATLDNFSELSNAGGGKWLYKKPVIIDNTTNPNNLTNYRVLLDSERNAVGDWHLDENTGQTATDSSRNNNNGILGSTGEADVNDPPWAIGQYGSALSFDGIDDYLEIPHANSFDLTDQLTIEAWVKLSSLGKFQTLINKAVYNLNGWRVFVDEYNKINFEVINEGMDYLVTNAEPLDTNLHHLVFTYDGFNGKIYQDGQELWAYLPQDDLSPFKYYGDYGNVFSDSDGNQVFPWGIEIWDGNPRSYFDGGQIRLIGDSPDDEVALAIPGYLYKPLVKEGLSYTQSFEVKLDNVQGNGMRIIHQWFDADQTAPKIIDNGPFETGTSDWHLASLTKTAPAGAVRGDIIIELYGSGTLSIKNPKFYLTDSNARKITTNSQNLTFGETTDHFWKLDGLLDEVKIYNRALSPSEVEARYNDGGFNDDGFFQKIKSDGSDIRFTDTDGTAELDYWVESFNNSATTKNYKIWIEVPSIPASSKKTIYMYYGNASATSSSQGDNTFDRPKPTSFAGGETSAGYASSGTLVSNTINPTGMYDWGILTYTKSDASNGGPAGTSITVDVLRASDNAVLATNVASGTDLNTAGVSNSETSIKLRANFSSNIPEVTPTLSDWTLNYEQDTTNPSAPTGLSALAVSTSQINLSWTGSTDTGGSGLAGYKIERAPDVFGSPGTFSQIDTSVTTNYSNSGLSPNTKYWYKVRADDKVGNPSNYSNPASATTLVPPSSDPPPLTSSPDPALPSSPTRPAFLGVERLWGQTSEGTSVAISQTGWGSSRVVLVARNDHFADALAGVPLAYAFRNAPGINSAVPLLLTQPRGLSSETKGEIQRLGASTVIILGGPGAILPTVETELWQTPGVTEVQRIWGETAPGTARDIFARIRSYASPTPNTAIIATQVNFQDALAVSSPAAANNMPILLSNLSSLPQETLEALSQGEVRKVIIVGGGAVVSPEVETELNNRGYPVLARLWGNTEYDTAVDIATSGNSLFNFTRPGAVFVARGDFFTDALSGGALASRMNPAPIVLTHPGGLSTALSSYLTSNQAHITKVYILGGPGALSQGLQGEIEGLIQ